MFTVTGQSATVTTTVLELLQPKPFVAVAVYVVVVNGAADTVAPSPLAGVKAVVGVQAYVTGEEW